MQSPVKRATRPVATSAPAGSTGPEWPDLLLATLVLFIWTSVWRIQDIFPILGSIKIALLAEFAAIGVFFASQSRVRALRWAKSPLTVLVLGLVLIMVLGLPTSLWPGKGVTFITRDFFPTLVLFLLIASSMRESKDLRWIALGILTGGVIYAAYVYKSHSVLVNGRLGSLEFYDANDFAMLLCVTMPFAIFFMRPAEKWYLRLYALGAMGLFVMMLIKSGSRGGFLGFIAVMTYTLFRYKAIPVRLRIGAVATGVAFILLLGSASYWEMMGTLLKPKDDYNMTEETGRKKVWIRGLGYMVTHPIVGVGVRAFPQAEGMLSASSKQAAEMGRGLKWSVAHNSFVELGAELGIPAILMFLSLFGISIRQMGRVRYSKKTPYVTRDDRAYAQMLVGAFVAFMVSGFFVSGEYFTMLYVLLALVVAMGAVLERRRRAFKQAVKRQATIAAMGVSHSTPVPGGLQLPPRKPPVPWLPSGT